jgi:hypothetical protein
MSGDSMRRVNLEVSELWISVITAVLGDRKALFQVVLRGTRGCSGIRGWGEPARESHITCGKFEQEILGSIDNMNSTMTMSCEKIHDVITRNHTLLDFTTSRYPSSFVLILRLSAICYRLRSITRIAYATWTLHALTSCAHELRSIDQMRVSNWWTRILTRGEGINWDGC